MLQRLDIQNYILIDELSIDFSGKMNVITGETGAGKSIIIGAVSLLLGQRASAPKAVTADDKIILEGHFSPNTKSQKILQPIFDSEDWDWDEEVIIRREYNSKGKSRVFINDSPVRLTDVQRIAPLLIELHQQFDHLSVRSEDFQLQVLDAVADTSEQLEDYRREHSSWTTNKKQLEKLTTERDSALSERDYKNFILTELIEANFQPEEIESLEEKVKLVQNTEGVVSTLQSATYTLQESDGAVLSQISALISELSTQSRYMQQLQDIVDRLSSTKIELQDIADTIEQLGDSIDWSQEDMDIWTDRLDMANRLLTKHQLRSTDELIALQEHLSTELQSADASDEQIQKLESTIQAQEERLLTQAEKISEQRASVIPSILDQVHEMLSRIGMEKAQMQIKLEKTPLTRQGIDKVHFLLDANQTGSYESIGKVASGGELNRIMLALKSIIAKKAAMPTLIFDEIDSGISGEPARQVGILMKQLADDHQVITITHQASIAAQGDMHWYIYKEESADRDALQTQIKSIQDAERESHIAELIGGKAGGESALAAAKKLLAERI